MMIEFNPHAKKRFKIRGIAESDVIATLKNPDKLLFDEDTGNFIAVKKVNGKVLDVAYVIIRNVARVVSTFLTSKLD